MQQARCKAADNASAPATQSSTRAAPSQATLSSVSTLAVQVAGRKLSGSPSTCCNNDRRLSRCALHVNAVAASPPSGMPLRSMQDETLNELRQLRCLHAEMLHELRELKHKLQQPQMYSGAVHRAIAQVRLRLACLQPPAQVCWHFVEWIQLALLSSLTGCTAGVLSRPQGTDGGSMTDTLQAQGIAEAFVSPSITSAEGNVHASAFAAAPAQVPWRDAAHLALTNSGQRLQRQQAFCQRQEHDHLVPGAELCERRLQKALAGGKVVSNSMQGVPAP